MENQDLLSLNEICYDCIQRPHNYFSIKQELIETKRKLILLEERLNKIEEKNKVTDKTTSIMQYGSKSINQNPETVTDNDTSGP
jgi:BMFP domain-containing protein YqiC